MEQKTFKNLMINNDYFSPALILGLSLVLSVLIGSYYLYKIKTATDTIEVTGSAQKVIDSDVVKWKANVSRTVAPDRLKEGNASMKKDLNAVKKFMSKNKIDKDSITITPMVMLPIYEAQNGSNGDKSTAGIRAYTLSQDITIESEDVDKIAQVAQDSGSLINDGVLFSNLGIEYYYSKLSDLKLEMLSEATKNAAERAKKIAESAGSGVGHLKSSDMGVMQITPVNSTETSDYGFYDTSSKQKQINAIVHAKFSLN